MNDCKEYNEYLMRHRKAVAECFYMLTGMRRDICDCDGDPVWHDSSKYSPEEYWPYRRHFYPAVDDEKEPEGDFDRAWLHHIHNNPHHWQYWVLVDGKNNIRALQMHDIDVYEMVADWGSFACLKQDGNELLQWYERNKDTMILHEETRKLVERLVPMLAKDIDEYFADKEVEE